MNFCENGLYTNLREKSMWKLVYFADNSCEGVEIASGDIPAELIAYGDDFVGYSLVWGMTPEGYRFSMLEKSGSLLLSRDDV